MGSTEHLRPKHRFHVTDLAGPSAVLEAAEAHHALHVLRLATGDAAELFDGQGRSATGVISHTSRSEVVVEIHSRTEPARRPGPAIHLAFATPKGKRLDWLLEKATELGVHSLQPLLCERRVVVPPQKADKRWVAICTSAARQSHQVYIPTLHRPIALADLLAGGLTGTGIIAHGGPPEPPAVAEIVGQGIREPISVLIGPEGGWTTAELASATAAGYRPARLGHTVLRIETAAVAVCAAVVALAKDAESSGFAPGAAVPS